jgi:hypothetical protein
MATARPEFRWREEPVSARRNGLVSRFLDRRDGDPPRIDRILTSGWRKPRPYVRSDPLKYAGRSVVTAEGKRNAADDDTTGQGVAAGPSDGQRVPEQTLPEGNRMSPVADETGTAGGSKFTASPRWRQPASSKSSFR